MVASLECYLAVGAGAVEGCSDCGGEACRGGLEHPSAGAIPLPVELGHVENRPADADVCRVELGHELVQRELLAGQARAPALQRQEVEQQMQAMSGGPATPIEQVSELGESIIQKLVAAGVTTVESLADMTPEQLEEVPGIGEKTLERISVAVRHYFGQYEEGEVNPNAPAAAEAEASPSDEAKAVEVDEPGTPDEPVEEATAVLGSAEDAPSEAAAETMEAESAADPEREHPVDEAEPVHVPNPEATLQETEFAEEGALDQIHETDEPVESERQGGTE